MKRTTLLLLLLTSVFTAWAQPVDIDAAFLCAGAQLRVLVARSDSARIASAGSGKIMPRSVNADGSLRMVGENDWCSGFFPGMLWQMYRYSLDTYWRQQAERNTWMLERVQHHNGSHDIGFMMGCSFGKAYELTGDNRYRDILLESARTLTTRFDPTVGCIRSWSWGGDRWRFPVIIDNMMNLELLFEASRISGDSTFQRIAVSHANRTLANHFRADHTSYHVVDYNPESGEPIRRMTFQGHHDESVWSRGQAWGLYGFTVCYRYTHNPAYLEQAQQIARTFFTLPHLPADLIPYWDMKDPRLDEAASVPRDASAAAIFASGLYELADYSEAADATWFRQLADRILQSLTEHYQSAPGTQHGFLLQHSTGNHPGGDEIDTSINYADYYYLEALNRSRRFRPMALDTSRSLEAALAVKHTFDAISLGNLTYTMPLHTGQRAQGPAGDPDYAIYGTCSADFDLCELSPAEYLQRAASKPDVGVRLSFDVSSDLDVGIANVNVVFRGKDHSGLGAHLVNVPAGETRHVDYDFDELTLTDLYSLSFYTDIKGRNISRHDSVTYRITNAQLEYVQHPEKTQGWLPDADAIVIPFSGYTTNGTKTALCAHRPKSPKVFTLTDATTGVEVYRGKARGTKTTIGRYTVLDFSTFVTPGSYILHYDDRASAPFAIGDDVLLPSAEKVLNFIHCQRCGDAVEGIHGPCHTDVYADHNGQSYPYAGGWHDAGDLSQQTLQTADVAFSLLETYDVLRNTSPALARNSKEEALFGLRQVLRCRFGDGYHASSIGLLHWTDGLALTYDDIHSVRQQNTAFDNFLYAAYEAYAARLLDDERLAAIAAEDFTFAREKFERDGIDRFTIEMEHTYNTSRCTFMAAASWAASMLYSLTHDEAYARYAADYASELLACQETRGRFAGFFYRDASHVAAVHFIHQSREQLPMQALTALCTTQPDHPSAAQWRDAVRLYGQYLKRTMAYTAPYGMLPSGVYRDAEYTDADGFNRLHLWAPANAHELYDQQLAEGVNVGDGLTLRRFPVWFSIFNGNEAIHLSSGKAAALCGRLLGDDELLQIAREQAYWTLGKNPFCQSLIYGEGQRYPLLDSFSSGDIMGAIPVGIRSFGNTDVPYWPLTNNACYKEVWLTSAGKWLSLIAEIQKVTLQQ